MQPKEHVNESAAKANLEYQSRMYRTEPKEADKVLLSLLDGLSGNLLDIGCSNGNLLKHIKDRHAFRLNGGDLSELRIEACRKDPELAGIAFATMDIMELPSNSFDVIVANAVLYAIEDFRGAMQSIVAALRPKGTFIAFDFFHHFNQELRVVEESDELPEGHILRMRSQSRTSLILESLGMSAQFKPFSIPISLPLDHSANIRTHTVKCGSENLQFRGAIYQPWCHLIGRRYR